jgi:hypothetical protein
MSVTPIRAFMGRRCGGRLRRPGADAGQGRAGDLVRVGDTDLRFET